MRMRRANCMGIWTYVGIFVGLCVAEGIILGCQDLRRAKRAAATAQEKLTQAFAALDAERAEGRSRLRAAPPLPGHIVQQHEPILFRSNSSE
jgi:hypothetical protein